MRKNSHLNMAAPMLQGEITFFSEAKGDKIIFVANNRDVVEVGSDISCDIRIENASLLHMKIQLDTDTGKVKKEERKKFKPQNSQKVAGILNIHSLP